MAYQKPLVVKTSTIQSLPSGDMAGVGDFPDWETNTLNWIQTRQAFGQRVGANYWQTNQVSTTFGSLSDTAKWFNGVLAPNGCIYGIPYDSPTVLKIDPTTDTATTFGSLTGSNKWQAGILAPNGCIYGIPCLSTTLLKIGSGFDDVPLDFCLSRHFNKF